ncbi:unnamed protein product, partial [Dibothriocephalus latus]
VTGRSKAVFCVLGEQWVHIKCAKIAPEIYEVLKKFDSEGLVPFCSTCKVSFLGEDAVDTNTESQEADQSQEADRNQPEFEKTDSGNSEHGATTPPATATAAPVENPKLEKHTSYFI